MEAAADEVFIVTTAEDLSVADVTSERDWVGMKQSAALAAGACIQYPVATGSP
jgi:hypothetical protein